VDHALPRGLTTVAQDRGAPAGSIPLAPSDSRVP
jgi:hypothetical protein